MLRELDKLALGEDLSVAWCNANAAATGMLEAISFATPAVEKLGIGTVALAIDGEPDAALLRRCREFIGEESSHTLAHRRLNASLLGYLGMPPPGLALLRAMLDGVRRRLALPARLLLVAALEHVAAVLSRRYLDQGDGWVFFSPYARQLFTLHARQELAHRSVVFDLCLRHGAAGRLGRALAMAAVLLGGLGYVAAAVPWIVYRKSGRRWGPALALLAGGVWRNSLRGSSWATLGELLSFSRGAYHPDRMAAAADASIK